MGAPPARGAQYAPREPLRRRRVSANRSESRSPAILAMAAAFPACR